MAKNYSNIQVVYGLAPEIECGVCGDKTPLAAQDTATTIRVGRCCKEVLIFTDHMLTIHGPKAGIIHPGLDCPPARET